VKKVVFLLFSSFYYSYCAVTETNDNLKLLFVSVRYKDET